MLDPKIVFVFYALAVVCFVLAALEGGGHSLARGATARVALVPLGLAFFVFPFMWNTGSAAF